MWIGVTTVDTENKSAAKIVADSRTKLVAVSNAVLKSGDTIAIVVDVGGGLGLGQPWHDRN